MYLPPFPPSLFPLSPSPPSLFSLPFSLPPSLPPFSPAKSSKIEAAEPRKPTKYWSGYNFSESWAPGEGSGGVASSTQMKTPQGLSSLHKVEKACNVHTSLDYYTVEPLITVAPQQRPSDGQQPWSQLKYYNRVEPLHLEYLRITAKVPFPNSGRYMYGGFHSTSMACS